MKKTLITIGSVFVLAIFAQMTGVSFAAATPTGLGGLGTTITPASGSIPIGNGSGSYTPALLTPGANTVVTNGSGSVTIGVTSTIVASSVIAQLFDNGGAVINVKSAPYNAKCDGVTDDAGSIQSAINVASKIGGTVFFPSGICLISTPLQVNTGTISLLGAGSNFFVSPTGSVGTVLAPTGNFPSGAYLIVVNSSTAQNVLSGDAVSDMKLVGNASATGASHLAAGILASAVEAMSLNNLHIQDPDGDGVHLQQIASGGDLGNITNVVVDGSVVGVGTCVTGIYDHVWESSVWGDEVLSCQNGYDVGNYVSVLGSHSDSNSQYGYEIGANSALVGSDVFDHSGYANVYINGSYAKVIGNSLNQAGQAGPGNFNGASILKGNGAINDTVVGNTVLAGASTTYFIYNADGGSTRLNVSGNTFTGAPITAQVVDTSGDSVYSNNIGLSNNVINSTGTPTNALFWNAAGSAVSNSSTLVMTGSGGINDSSTLNIASTTTVLGSLGVGLGTGVSPRITAQIDSANANPFTAGTASGNFAILDSGGNYGIWFGQTGTGRGWISGGRDDSSIYYPLLLQVNGGGVGIGTNGTINAALELAGSSTSASDGALDVEKSSGATILYLNNAGSLGLGSRQPSSTVQVIDSTNNSSTVRIGAVNKFSCFEMTDASNTANLDYVFISNGVVTSTATKPNWCQ
jgi:hypothetical protein